MFCDIISQISKDAKVLQNRKKGMRWTMSNFYGFVFALVVALLGLLVIRFALISAFFVLVAVAVRIMISVLLSGTRHSKNLA